VCHNMWWLSTEKHWNIHCMSISWIYNGGRRQKKPIKPLHFKINAVHWQCLDEDNKVKIVYWHVTETLGTYLFLRYFAAYRHYIFMILTCNEYFSVFQSTIITYCDTLFHCYLIFHCFFSAYPTITFCQTIFKAITFWSYWMVEIEIALWYILWRNTCTLKDCKNRYDNRLCNNLIMCPLKRRGGGYGFFLKKYSDSQCCWKKYSDFGGGKKKIIWFRVFVI
jgi:hypothetical protein